MILDSTIYETRPFAIHPETGEPWPERQEELMDLSLLRYDSDFREEAEPKYAALMAETKFRTEPNMVQYHFFFGAAFEGMTPPPMFGCHPNTWAKLPDSAKAAFDEVVDGDEERRKLNAMLFTSSPASDHPDPAAGEPLPS